MLGLSKFLFIEVSQWAKTCSKSSVKLKQRKKIKPSQRQRQNYINRLILYYVF